MPKKTAKQRAAEVRPDLRDGRVKGGIRRHAKSIAAAAARGEAQPKGTQHKRLTIKQERLVDAVTDPEVLTLNEAAAMAGMAASQASTSLRNPKIEAAIAQRRRERLDKSRDLRALGERLLRSGAHELERRGMDPEQRLRVGGAILELESKVRDKLGDPDPVGVDTVVLEAQTTRLVRSIVRAAIRCALERPDKARDVLARLETKLSPHQA